MKSRDYFRVSLGVTGLMLLALAGAPALAFQVPGPLVNTDWLADHQSDVVVLDVRKDAATYVGKPLGPEGKLDLKKLTGHIPGAVSVPWKGIVTKTEQSGAKLKGMMPSPEAFAQLMQSSGVNTDSAVVIVGRGSNVKDQAYAARLYVAMKYFGHDNMALLDGGTAQWAKEGRPLVYTKEESATGDFVVTGIRNDIIASTADVENAVETGDVQLVDCRTEDFYLGLNYKRGFVSPAHQGHLAGARTLPFVLLGDNGGPAKLFSPEDVRKIAALKGVDLTAPTITYCNTGTTASLSWFALHELLGNDQARLYDGSMHAWSMVDSDHPVATIEELSEAGPLAETDDADAGTEALVSYASMPSLRTLVDERRDALRQRRRAFFDALSSRHLFQPQWMIAHRELMDDYRDSVRQAHRQHRDLMALYHESLRGAHAPGLRAFRDRSEMDYYLSQMEQLDRQEFRDSRRFASTYTPWFPFPY